MVQKWIVVILAVVLLTGCGQNEEAAPSEESRADAGEAAAVEEIRADVEEGAAEKVPPPQDDAATEEEHTLTVSEAVNFLLSLPPQTLGLTGDTMDNYRAYPATEVVSVDGMACSKLFVYQTDENSETNVIQGIYLLTRGTERRLFQLDQKDGTVTELPLPALLID